ncbi:DNA mismatch repair protein MutS [Aurantimonas endophytica]|uniref:DNA mismatch repair protein MutS n=1 Tax=Aurantimonas endophytica TaxID=1522175 RepID=A0A7W6HHG8_9HYPH|nr:DNA mismatch repair protein MutS [Aurantimonas endophytica]MBB4005301.1 DNA mismatch repair protein MutS [Aurantimonas endophytica]MCO6406037.1 DNA mismatch repair protein MutS [Aurantimonas endophytica]
MTIDKDAAPTPMMAQYIEIKAANPDCLLFYRMGDFYELFFDDAAEASRALGIALTKRGKHLGADIPMAGVPVVSADDYLQRLIGLGHRVAVCEQIEDPAEARKRGGKSVVRRDVVRLVTPGTITEEALLDPGRPNFLMALARLGGSGENAAYALAWTDLSTGTFRLAESSRMQLEADIAAIEPSEIVVAEPVFHDPSLQPLFRRYGRRIQPEPQTLFDGTTAEERVCRFFGVATLEGFGGFGRTELSAAAALIAYLGKTQMAARPGLQRPERIVAGSLMQIDPATRASLELTRTTAGKRQGSLLSVIDRTRTGPGARLLAGRLAAPLTDPAAIRERQASVGWFVDAAALRQRLREALSGLPDIERALSRLSLGRGGPRDLAAIRDGLEAALAIGAMLGDDLPSELAMRRKALAALPAALLEELSRLLADSVPLQRRDGGFVREGALPALDEARTLREDVRRVVAELQGRYAAETGIRNLRIKHNNVLGYFIEVGDEKGRALVGVGDFVHRQTMASAMRFSTSELAELESRIAGAAAEALRLELECFDSLAGQVEAAADALRQGAEALAVLDVSAALAELAVADDWVAPVVDDSLAFAVECGRHPVVEAALKAGSGHPFVANDCDLSPPADGSAGAIWLITGPNMGGKSTFLRQNALIAVLAQVGSYVPATKAHIGVVDRLFSRVGASDDLAEGRSTFMVEMVETAAILNQAGERALVILDEIGRGTATYDGLSIAFAAVEHLHEVNRCRALFATHFHEMTALAARLARMRNATMRVKEWEGDVVFLHEVKPGVADRSYGIQVAKLAGLPPAVVERARHVLEELEKGEQAGRRTALVDDLPLFSAMSRRADPPVAAPPSPVCEAVAALDPDALSPREALDALYRLKGLVGATRS